MGGLGDTQHVENATSSATSSLTANDACYDREMLGEDLSAASITCSSRWTSMSRRNATTRRPSCRTPETHNEARRIVLTGVVLERWRWPPRAVMFCYGPPARTADRHPK